MEVDCDVKELFLDWYIYVLYYFGSYSMTSNWNNNSSTNKMDCLGMEQVTEMFKKCFTYQQLSDGVHLTLPRHIFPVQIKSRSMLHHESVWVSLKQNKRNLKKPNTNPNPNL